MQIFCFFGGILLGLYVAISFVPVDKVEQSKLSEVVETEVRDRMRLPEEVS